MEPGVFNGYQPGDFFDEAFAGPGQPRGHYERLIRFIEQLGDDELARRAHLRDASFRTKGITFTLTGDEDGLERTFPMDLLPRIIPAEEWSVVETGLAQRVRTLNKFLDDVYAGEQAAIRDGVVPRHVVTSSDGFTREAMGIHVPHGARCLVAGIDLVRDAQGVYRVLEDNVRNPSGISYVLENRAATARILPRVLGAHAVRRVDDYGPILLSALRAIAPSGGPSPRIAVLTPGPYNSAYFEHVFAARQLGAELVEGRDLVVDDHVVYMRTTNGLERVDVIYRRIDDRYLDAVGFHSTTTIGVSGLLAAVRAGNVALANSIGNGAADDKLVYAFVPDLIRYYLGEEPILPNVPTYVLWNPEQRAEALDRLHELVVKPVSGAGGYDVIIGPRSTEAELAEVRKRIEADPRGWIAQEVVALSRHPTLIDGVPQPRHIDLRPFVITRGDEIEVIPGGLTRVALREGSLIVNSSQGGGSKDTWVLVGDGGPLMLARLAEDLYWAGRYLERLQHTSRVLDVTTEIVFSSPRIDQREIWERALATLVLDHAFQERYDSVDNTTVPGFCVIDPDNPGSIASLIRALRENVRRVRELVSSELWESVNDLYLRFYATSVRRDLDDHPAQLYAFVKSAAHAVVGVAVETMSRDDAARFFELGMHMERAGTTTRVLGTQAATLEARGRTGLEAWAPVLRTCAARETFVRTGKQADAAAVATLLLFSPVFPRSVRYSVCITDEHIASLLDEAHNALGGGYQEELPLVARRMGRLRGRVDYGDIEEVMANGFAATAVSLETDLRAVHKALAQRFFHHSTNGELQVQELRSMEPELR